MGVLPAMGVVATACVTPPGLVLPAPRLPGAGLATAMARVDAAPSAVGDWSSLKMKDLGKMGVSVGRT